MALAWCIAFIANTFVLNNVQLHIIHYLNSRFDINVIEKVIEKTGNKNAALKAFRLYDASIKEAIKNGETFFTPHRDVFEKHITFLENTINT